MPCIIARHGARLSTVCALLVLTSLTPARAEDDVLSDRLTDQILEMNKLDLVRKLDGELERRLREIQQQPTAERASKLRELLRSRAATFESLEDFDRAEADYNTLINIKPVNPLVFSDRGYFYMRLGRFADAARDFVTGSRLAPAQATRHLEVVGRGGGGNRACTHGSVMIPILGLPRRDQTPLRRTSVPS